MSEGQKRSKFARISLAPHVIMDNFSLYFQTDIEPPKFASCPNDTHMTSTEKKNKIYLPGVTVTDNVGVQFFKTNRKNGSEFTWGEHNITYTAMDKAGNTAGCYFRIIIVGMYN